MRADGFELVEGFYVKIRTDDVFHVKGVAQPPHGVIAYPAYIADPHGDRVCRSSGIRYRRLRALREQIELLERKYLELVRYDELLDMRVPVIPRGLIKHVYNPVIRANEIVRREHDDVVLNAAREMINVLIKVVPLGSIGITGSILLGMHSERSDVDIVVYGGDEGIRAYRLLRELVESDDRFRRLGEDELRELYARRAVDTPIDFRTFVMMESRRALECVFLGRRYSIKLVDVGSEPYGIFRYRRLGEAIVEVEIVDSSRSMLIPCRYRVRRLRTIGGLDVEIQEVFSQRLRFAEIGREGEIFVARGIVERVTDLRSGESWYRLSLDVPGGFMMLIREKR